MYRKPPMTKKTNRIGNAIAALLGAALLAQLHKFSQPRRLRVGQNRRHGKPSWSRPHQAAREIARRRHNLNGGRPSPVPRRLWTMDIPFLNKRYYSSDRGTLARTRFAKGSAALKPVPVVML